MLEQRVAKLRRTTALVYYIDYARLVFSINHITEFPCFTSYAKRVTVILVNQIPNKRATLLIATKPTELHYFPG